MPDWKFCIWNETFCADYSDILFLFISSAAKAMKVHQDLPPISRCHTYEINYKYTYRCTKCGYK